MSVNGISSGTLNVPQLNPANSTSQTASVRADRDGDSDGGRVSGSSGAPARGSFAAAINQALSQIGVSGSAAPTASGATSTTQDPLQALPVRGSAVARRQSAGGGTRWCRQRRG
jgi:hypothetical protein